jgi:hypothetical protein
MRSEFRHTPRRSLLLLTTVLAAGLRIAAAQAPVLPSADEVMAQATTKAAAEHKDILLTFSASWCGPCRMFEGFLDDPKIRPIMEKKFVYARLDVGERPSDKRHADSPGGVKLMSSLGGATAGYPFIVMLDDAGKPIVNSLRPDGRTKDGSNIGYPALPVEVDWFMQMLQQAAPSLSPQETATIRNWLHERGHS